MEDIIKYFKYGMLFPIIVTMLVAIVIITILFEKSNGIYYGNQIFLSYSSFVWPVPNSRTISSPFGRRSSPTKGASSFHQGVDIAAAQGSNVQAIASGTVTFAGWSGSGGYMIIIEHGDNMDSRYCHLGEVLYVTKGQKVYTGQIIATVGPKYVSGGRLNGATTGPHLHLGIRKDGEFVNPLLFFQFE